MNVVLWIVTTVLALCVRRRRHPEAHPARGEARRPDGLDRGFRSGMVKTISGLELLAARADPAGPDGYRTRAGAVGGAGPGRLDGRGSDHACAPPRAALVVVNAILLVLALVVVWGRLGLHLDLLAPVPPVAPTPHRIAGYGPAMEAGEVAEGSGTAGVGPSRRTLLGFAAVGALRGVRRPRPYCPRAAQPRRRPPAWCPRPRRAPDPRRPPPHPPSPCPSRSSCTGRGPPGWAPRAPS